MTIPYQRTRALVETKLFLQDLTDPAATPRVPKRFRDAARALLQHYPSLFDIEKAHKELPDVFGPVPPFQVLPGNPQVIGVIEATKAGAPGVFEDKL
jgi:hypothetical protein